MPPTFRRLFEGPDEIDYAPDPMGRVGAGMQEIHDPTDDPRGNALFQDFREAWAEGHDLPDLFGRDGMLDIKEPVGPAARNRRPDVAKIETFLDALGEHDAARTEGPTGFYGIGFEDNLKAYQARNGLTPDGLVNPDGETIGRIKQDLTETMGPGVLGGGEDGAGGSEPGARLMPVQSKGGSLSRERKLPATHRQAERGSMQRFNEELDRIEDRVKQIEEDGIKRGFELAPRALRHFREGSGTTLRVKRDWLRHRAAVRVAEIRNQKRFENWLTGKRLPSPKSPHERIIGDLLRLKDGESLDRRSTWDSLVRVSGLKQLWSDLHNATGTSNVKSVGSFRLTRKGNTITIVGNVDHIWSDVYDWKKGEEVRLLDGTVFRHDDALSLQHHRGARPFRMESRWSQTVTGKISIGRNRRTGQIVITGIKLDWNAPDEGRAPQ
jgi:Putative peptidoglycan binding domain